MGRKGLGKLAGFGVAHLVTVISKQSGKPPIKIELDYDVVRKHKATSTGVPVKEIEISKDEDIGDSGTKIILSRLVYEPMKSRDATIAGSIAEHFAFIKPAEFKTRLNGKIIGPKKKNVCIRFSAAENG